MKKSLIVVGVCAAVSLLAQGPPPGPGGRMGPGGPGGRGGMMGRGGGMNAPVAGAPYSAVEVTETSQTLPNGNVISRKSQSNVFRDGMGRVRTETTVPMRRGPGQISQQQNGTVTSGTARTLINIHDPVAGVTRELDPQAKVSHEQPLPGFRGGNAVAGNRPARGPNAAVVRTPVADPNVVSEALSMQTINGVQATGTRVTRTIPVGEIGNAQPIQIIHETWISADLKVPVMVKTADPRFGTTTTQLTNITRSEPDPALFQAPSDFTVTKGRGPGGPGGMRGGQGGRGAIKNASSAESVG